MGAFDVCDFLNWLLQIKIDYINFFLIHLLSDSNGFVTKVDFFWIYNTCDCVNLLHSLRSFY